MHNEVDEMQGCYLHHDSVLKQWVRSGKAARSDGGFRARLNNHQKSSALQNYEDRQSDFCMSHPSGRLGLQGKHEYLNTHCGFGFHPNSQDAVQDIIDSDYCNWGQADSYFERLKSKNKCMCTAKTILIAYLYECCHDLFLSKKCNVSSSPGFESIHGQHREKIAI